MKDWIIENHTHYSDNCYNILEINQDKRSNIDYDESNNTIYFDFYMINSDNSSGLVSVQLFYDNLEFFYIASSSMEDTEIYSGHGMMPVNQFIVAQTDSVNQIIDKTYSSDPEIIANLNNISASLINMSLISAQRTFILKNSPVSIVDLGFKMDI